ncbi:MAG: hypothetical protein ACREKS_04150 [Candidatus Rokuibacteriota bacterium]
MDSATLRLLLERSGSYPAPGVAFLASSLCDFSGVVLRAAGGRFSTATCHVGDDVDLGADPVEPEAVAKHWREISGQTTRFKPAR